MIGTLLSLYIAALSLNAEAKTALEAHRQAGDLPGVSAAVIVAGETVFSGGAGVADLESGRAMSADTPLYAGSLSKIFTAALALGMVEDGDLSLDTTPDIRGAADDASVRALLTHSAGLPREGSFDFWFSGVFPDAARLDAYLSQLTLVDEPRRRSSYSNIGYATLGRVLEQASGRRYAELLNDRLLRPLDLTATGAGNIPGDLSRGYTPPGRVIPSAERPFAGLGAVIGSRRLREYHDARAMTPAFGIVSSAADLARLGAFIIGVDHEEVLSPAMRRRMLEAQQRGRSYGLRIDSLEGHSVARHGGWFAAHRSHILLDAGSDIVIVVLANSDDGSPDSLAEALYAKALDHVDRANTGDPSDPP